MKVTWSAEGLWKEYLRQMACRKDIADKRVMRDTVEKG